MRLGVYAATLTPFTTTGDVDHAFIPRYLAYLLDHGIAGLLVLGTNGEFASLTVRERQELLATVRRHAPAELPLIANVGATSVPEVLELARHARETGAQGVALLPPYYFPLTDEGFLRTARATADAFEDAIYLYNIPRYTGYAIPPAVVETLAREGVARGLKDSSQDLEYFRRLRERLPQLELFIGSDTTLVEGLRAGADGVVSGMANTYPDLISAAYEAFHAASDELPALREKILYLRETFAAYPYLAATRRALALRGLDPGPPRLPLVPLDPDAADRLAGELREFREPQTNRGRA